MSPEDFRRLVAAGLSSEQIALVMEMMDAREKQVAEAEEARKAKGRERVAKWRETNKVTQRNVTETSPNVTEPLVRDRVAPAEDNLNINKQSSSKQNAAAKDLAEFRDALASLDADRLDALVKHRKSKRAQNTGHAARLFIRDVEACGITLAEAVDTCISRNWLTVKPDWIAKPQPRGSPPGQQSGNVAAILKSRREERKIDDAHDAPGTPRLIASR